MSKQLVSAIWENIVDAVATSESDDEAQEQLAAYEQLLASPQRMRKVARGIAFALVDAVAMRQASLSTDAGGRAHKGKGEGGGQFTKGGSGDTTQPDAYTVATAKSLGRTSEPLLQTRDGQWYFVKNPGRSNEDHYFIPGEDSESQRPEPTSRTKAKPQAEPAETQVTPVKARAYPGRVPNPSSTLSAAYKAIDANEDLSDEQRDQYAAAFEQVSANIPDSAHALIEDGLKKGGIRLYADPFEVMNGMWDEIESHVQKGKSMWVKMLDLVFEPKKVREAQKLARRNSTLMAPAAFSSLTGGLHLDGGDLAEAPDLFGKDTHAQVLPHLYAHELTHAIDLNGRFSNTPEWAEAWQEEIADGGLLTEYGRTLLVEGFAEMGRAVYGGGTDLAEVERVLPKCSKFFKDNGLWPA